MNRSIIFILGFVFVISPLLAGCGQGQGETVASSSVSADELYKQGQALATEGKLVESRNAYQEIMTERPDYKNIEQVQQDLYALNMKILFSNTETPKTVIHEVQPGDTLGKIAKKYDVTLEMIRIPNNIHGDVIRVGQKLRIWTGKFSIHVDKSQNILILKNDEAILKVYAVATGKNNSTPVGTFKITTKLEDPVWFRAGAVIPPESPDNVLGTRWLGFDIEGYGIHGTVEPDKMGQQVTAGCVRMRNQDVEELFKIVPRGTEVTIVD